MDELDRKEEWAKIKPSVNADGWSSVQEGSISEDMVGVTPSVRVNLSVLNHFVLPNQEYKDIIGLYTTGFPSVCKLISQQSATNRDELARITLHVYINNGREFELLDHLVQLEIFSTEDLNIVFRGNSIATKAIDYYMKIVGMGYLHSTLGDLVKAVYKSKESCEVT